MPVSKRLQVRTLDALRQAGTPLSTAEVAMLVGRSYESARQALVAVGAAPVDDSQPTKWTIETPSMPVSLQKVPSKHEGFDMTVSTTEFPAPVLTWNTQRESLGAAITKLEIKPTDKPSELAKKLGTTAGSMAYVAYRLNEVATRPDWYELLTEER